MTREFHDVALVGFSPSEYSTFETFFRLVSSRRVKPFRASMHVANASMVMLGTNDVAEIERTVALLKPDQPLITIGTRRLSIAWRHLERPINLNAVLMTVDAALSGAAQHSSPAPSIAPAAAAQPRPAPSSPASPPIDRSRFTAPASDRVVPRPALVTQKSPPIAPSLTPLSQRPVVASKPIDAPALKPALPVTNVTPFPTPARESSVAPLGRDEAAGSANRIKILVVDDSDVALKFIHARLSAFGFQVDKSSSGEEALTRVTDGEYAFVFLDVMMQGLDGYQTCKAIKGRRYPGGRVPVVVMLTSRGGAIDKVRGTFAGCDGYLTKPLDETKMLKILLKHDPNLGNAISTLLSPSTSAATTLPGPRNAAGADPLAAAYANLDDRGG